MKYVVTLSETREHNFDIVFASDSFEEALVRAFFEALANHDEFYTRVYKLETKPQVCAAFEVHGENKYPNGNMGKRVWHYCMLEYFVNEQ